MIREPITYISGSVFSNTSMSCYTVHDTIRLPAASSSVCFGSEDLLTVGSVDGSLRLYHLPSPRVIKAVRQLGDEVSSAAWSKLYDADHGVVWIASGRKVYCFDLAISKPSMILSATDAQKVLEIGEDEDDVLNELSVNENKKSLFFTTDNGTVGLVDLSTYEVSRMKTNHNSICGSVRAIPSRPNEAVSGGYDSTLLHFDTVQRSTLSRHKITVPEPSAGVSLSPSFVLSLDVSSTGMVAAGLADGRVWFGAGGDRNLPSTQKKRARKWEGLRETDSISVQIAEGPVVGVSFVDPTTLVTCTLLGKLAKHTISYSEEGKVELQQSWSSETKIVEKVNAMTANSKWLVLAGLSKDAKGVAEVWKPESSDANISVP
ncbi:WD40 repeat-like protein [Cristinia sonorae]|uniref:WD40 repeat-like protein n=1 Tax=Cristinia sonorae TaxID=1940300 RepID=A0A8K0UX71_9AGAR|nr:WD40 repeat-like protein [Cristinia sonorae]